MALHHDHHHDDDYRRDYEHGAGLEPVTLAVELAARAVTAVDRAVNNYQGKRAAEAVGWFAREGEPGPSLFVAPDAARPDALAGSPSTFERRGRQESAGMALRSAERTQTQTHNPHVGAGVDRGRS